MTDPNPIYTELLAEQEAAEAAQRDEADDGEPARAARAARDEPRHSAR